MDDIFDTKSDSTDVFKDMAANTTKGGFENKKENYWDKMDISPSEIDVTKFNKTGKSFAVYVHPENDMPEEAFVAIFNVANALLGQGYTFRHTGNKDNALHNKILAVENAAVKSYLPWKKFNPNVNNPIMVTPLGYKIAIGIHKAFMRLPAAVRAILGKDVNALVGEDATDPVDFILAWTDGGDEVLGRNVDFKKIGNNTFILQVAKRANIPVFNVFNSDFIDRFKNAIK